MFFSEQTYLTAESLVSTRTTSCGGVGRKNSLRVFSLPTFSFSSPLTIVRGSASPFSANIYPFDYDILQLSVDLALERDITVYDAYFLTLARETDSIFITSDEKLYDRIGDLNFVRTL